MKNNSLEGLREGKKMKDSTRVNNIFQYLTEVGIKIPEKMIEFIDKTIKDYESQT
jgi:hypothetical protein